MRQREFLAALALAGITQLKWCERYGVSREHLRFVLRGERKGGAELESAIDRTIAKYLPERVA